MIDKLEPMPWFAFNVGEYIKDTMRLVTELHGAYLLLMLDYYGTGTPCPDDDFVLAAVAKLSPEAWAKHRKVLAPFFDIREGYWFHKRIEREMREASQLHADRIAAAVAGGHARWAKQGAKPGQSKGKQPQDTARARKHAKSSAPAVPEALPTALPQQCQNDAHLQVHPSLTEGGEAPPEAVEAGIGTPIPKDFLPGREILDRAGAAGMNVADIDAEVRKFIGQRSADGSFSHDWDGSFAVWIEREIKHRAKVPPRIEVDNKRFVPTEADYDKAVAFWVRTGKWVRDHGPEPGQLACRVPKEILEKHGLDPATGLKRRAAS